jgi:DNA-binding transcriptional MerR regulator
MTQRHHLPLANDIGIGVAIPLLPPRVDSEGAKEPGEGEEERLYQVGDIAKAAGKTVRAIHHYEELGLLRPHARSKGRYRLYDEAALTRVRWISKLHDLGLSLSQIQQVVSLWESSPSAPEAMARVRAIYQQKLEETRAQIAHLSTLERELEASLTYLDTCETCDPAELVGTCSKCNHHGKDQAEPDLVAGIHGGNGRKTAAIAR